MAFSTRQLLAWTLLALGLLTGRLALAQGPTVDPAFVYGGIFAPSAVQQAFQQPDGKTLLLGAFQKVLGQFTGPLVRLAASGTQLDQSRQTLLDYKDKLTILYYAPTGRFYCWTMQHTEAKLLAPCLWVV